MTSNPDSSLLAAVSDILPDSVSVIDIYTAPYGTELTVSVDGDPAILSVRPNSAADAGSDVTVRAHGDDPGIGALATVAATALRSKRTLREKLIHPTTRGWVRWRPGSCPALVAFAAGRPLDGMWAEATNPIGTAFQRALVGDTDGATEEVSRLRGLGAHAELLAAQGLAYNAVGAVAENITALEQLLDVEHADARAGRILDLAGAHAAGGDPERARELLDQLNGGHSPESTSRCAEIFEALEDYGRARMLHVARLETGGADDVVRLALWRGDTDEARSFADRCRGDQSQIQAAIALFEDRPADAINLLDDSSTSRESLLIKAEALLRLGQYRAAEGLAAEVHEASAHFPALVIRYAARARSAASDAKWQKSTRSQFFDPLCAGVFSAFGADAATTDRATKSVAAATELFEDVLLQMRGNRTTTVTRFVDGRLERVRPNRGGREQSVEILRRFAAGESRDTLIEDFRRLQSSLPLSPFPWTYGGELLLWLGEVDQARAWFIEALRRCRTRWAFVGLSACEMLKGRSHRARAISWVGEYHCGKLPQSTVPVIIGEIELNRGRPKQAAQLLSQAVGYKSTRVGARVNLALAHLAMGDFNSAHEQWDEVTAQVPGACFYAEARSQTKDPRELEGWLHAVLDRLAGNRSSWMRSLRDNDGRVRPLPAAAPMGDAARRILERAQ